MKNIGLIGKKECFIHYYKNRSIGRWTSR
jgi:hypothetical protein